MEAWSLDPAGYSLARLASRVRELSQTQPAAWLGSLLSERMEERPEAQASVLLQLERAQAACHL
jgi:hypothetical protein